MGEEESLLLERNMEVEGESAEWRASHAVWRMVVGEDEGVPLVRGVELQIPGS